MPPPTLPTLTKTPKTPSISSLPRPPATMRLFVLFSTVLSLLTLLTLANADIARWCAKTPFPSPCNYHLTHGHLPQPLKDHHEFYDLLLQVTLARAIRAQSHLALLGPSCHDEPERAGWLDCWKLYGNTVVQLNRTFRGSVSADDGQTWLSAALTNTQTCRKGFADLKTSSKIIQPVLSYNVSELISNCLAVNNSSINATVASINWMVFEKNFLQQLTPKRADMVVALDGSGRYRSIKAAIDAATRLRLKGFSRRIMIYIKAGVYDEIITVTSRLYDLTLLGDGIGKTIITGSRSVAGGYTTFSSATFSVFGDGFIARRLTFRNTFGPGSQAVALLSGSDRSVFYRCSMEGYQDTLSVYTQRQFYRECDIYGTIDFIFGNAAVVIQKSSIILRKPLSGESNVITAQGRSDPLQNTGIVIQASRIRAGRDLRTAGWRVHSYLGRPWQLHSRTLYLQNYMDNAIDPAGWMEFNGRFALDTLYYVEYNNTGPGSRLLKRVNWKGFHEFSRASQVSEFTVGNFIGGGKWIPPTGVPFDLGF